MYLTTRVDKKPPHIKNRLFISTTLWQVNTNTWQLISMTKNAQNKQMNFSLRKSILSNLCVGKLTLDRDFEVCGLFVNPGAYVQRLFPEVPEAPAQ